MPFERHVDVERTRGQRFVRHSRIREISSTIVELISVENTDFPFRSTRPFKFEEFKRLERSSLALGESLHLASCEFVIC